MSLMRSAVLATVVTLAATALAGGAHDTSDVSSEGSSEALAAVPIPVERLAATAPCVFDVAMNAASKQATGRLTFRSSITMKTAIEDGRVVMDDTWRIMGRTYRVRMQCTAAAGLPVEMCEIEMRRGDGEPRIATMTVADGIASISAGAGEPQQIPFPAGTITHAALLRIVPHLPKTAGVSYTFPAYSEPIEISARTPADGETFAVHCVGTEEIALDSTPAGAPDGAPGKTMVACTRYDVQVNKPYTVYVDDTGRVRQIVADEGSTVMVRRPDGDAIKSARAGTAN